MSFGPISWFSGRSGLVRALPLAIVAVVLAGVLIFLPGQQRDATVSSAAMAGNDAQSEGGAEPILVAEAAGATKSFDGSQRQAIEEIVRSYLLKNPEILLEMQTEFERRAEISRNAQMKNALEENADQLYRSPTSPVAGNPDGDVTVVEFFDYNCGYCRRAIPSMAKLIEKDTNVRVLFKEFPIFGKESEDAARIAIAAKKQGKYWEMHRALLEAPGRAGKEKGMRLAKKLDLDIEKLKSELNSPEVTGEIEVTRKLAESMGIRGTPHFFVGDQVIPGAPEDLYDQLRQRIAVIRKNGCAVC